MAPITVALLAFALALAGILLGSVMQKMLPEGHLSSDSKQVVKLSMGVVATLAALVLGLLVASAKSTYDASESAIHQLTAYVSTRTSDANSSGHQRSDAIEIPAFFTPWQLDTRPLFGSSPALDDHLVRWFFSHGAGKRDDFGVTCHMCPI